MKINSYSLVNTYDGFNKDRFIIKDNWFTVADGVSSEGAQGALAAEVAVKTVNETDLSIFKSKRDCKKFMYDLDKIVSSESRGCTTFTSTFIKNNKLVLMHTGDSECYIVYEKEVKEITKPFCVTYAMYLAGNLKLHEVKRARGSNILTECLGQKGLVTPQIEVFDLKDAKGLILCSDGANYVYPEYMFEIFNLFGKGASQEICEQAQNLGSKDDVTVICVEF